MTTGKFDCEGNEIFVGDKVIKAWGWFTHKGEILTYTQIHTITVRDAHRMGNGEMHDDGGGKIFCLGTAYNFWKGKEVKKLTENEVHAIGMPEDATFFWDGEKYVRFTDQHLMQLSDEDWQKELEKRRKREYEIFFGN